MSANVIGPSATFSEVSTSADCAGKLVSGGGTRLAQSTPTVQHNGIRLYASVPTRDGTTAAGSGDESPTRWLSSGGSGGGVPNDAQTLGYALCLDSDVAATRVVAASTRGPAETYDMTQATATCPADTRLLSGGARTTPGTVGSLKPIGSFPSDAAGRPLTAGADPSSWTAVGLNGGGGDQDNTTHAFAICAVGPAPPNVAITHATVPGPAAATSAAQASVACPAGSTLLGGGAFISDAFGLPGSQGDHLTASYPSDERGTPVASGAAAAWTAASHTGGVDSGALTQTDVWALCASEASAPPPLPSPLPEGAAGAPLNTVPPAVAGTARRGRVLTAQPGTWAGAPASYTYAWLRCSDAGNACTTIAAARRATYRLTLADAGARIRVRVVAANGAGAGAPAVSAASAIVAAGPVSRAQILTQLRGQIAPRGRATRVASLLARAPIVLPFRALRSGRATVTWYLPAARGARAKVAARGSRSFPGARSTTFGVRLTPAGRRAIGVARRLRLTAVGTFTAPGAKQLRATKTFQVQR